MLLTLPPPDPGFEVMVANRGVSKGLSQTEGPQIIPRAFVQLGPAQIGVQWKNVESTEAEGEGAASADWQRKLGATEIGFGVTYKFRTGVAEPTDHNALEINGYLGSKWGKAGARIGAFYSPDDLGSTKQSLYLEGGSSYDLTETLRFSANLGHRERSGDSDYTSFNAGISKLIGKLTIEARYYDTAQSDLGEAYRKRVVVSVRVVF